MRAVDIHLNSLSCSTPRTSNLFFFISPRPVQPSSSSSPVGQRLLFSSVNSTCISPVDQTIQMESSKRKQLSKNFGPDLEASGSWSTPSKLLGTHGVTQLLLTGHLGTKRQRTHVDPDTNSSSRYSFMLLDHQAKFPQWTHQPQRQGSLSQP